MPPFVSYISYNVLPFIFLQWFVGLHHLSYGMGAICMGRVLAIDNVSLLVTINDTWLKNDSKAKRQ